MCPYALARACNQLIDDLKKTFIIYAAVSAEHHGWPGHIFPIDSNGRSPRHIVAASNVFGAFHFAIHGKGVIGVYKFLTVHALIGKPICHDARVGNHGFKAILMDGSEDVIVIFAADTDRIQCIERACHRPPGRRIKNCGDVPKFNVCRLAFEPAFDRSLKVITMYAAIPKELDDLDFFATVSRLGWIDHRKVAP